MSLTLNKVADIPTPTVGTNVTYTITVDWENEDVADVLNNLTIIDTFPAQLNLISAVSSQGNVVIANNGFTVTVDPINPGTIVTVTAVTTVLQPGFIINLANASGTDAVGDPFDAAGSETIVASQPIPCLHPSTLVLRGDNRIVPISSLRANDYVVTDKNEIVEIQFNMKFGDSDDFILIEKDALAINQPVRDLTIRKGHPILLHGKEINPEKLIKHYSGVRRIKLSEPASVYSLCTKKRVFVMMQGIPVATWAESDILSQRKFKYTKL